MRRGGRLMTLDTAGSGIVFLALASVQWPCAVGVGL